MITINVYPDAHDGEALATKANAVLENYKSHKGKVLRTSSIPEHRSSLRSISSPWFFGGQTLLRWHLLASNWWTASDARSSIRIAFTVKKLRPDERLAKKQRPGKGKGVDGMERHSFSSFIEQSFGPMKDLTQGSVIRHLLHMSAFLAVRW